MKSLRYKYGSAFADGFERGFNAPWYFLAGGYPKRDYAKPEEEKMVVIKARIIAVKDDKEEAATCK